MINKHKYILAGVLLLFIIITGIIGYIKRDTIFLHRVEIKYGDNCVETFDNGVLMTPECTEGRAMEEAYNGRQLRNPQWNLNLTYLK